MRIGQLEIGQIVDDGKGSYGIVSTCVHGNEFYAFYHPSGEEFGKSVTVTDFYRNHLADCCDMADEIDIDFPEDYEG